MDKKGLSVGGIVLVAVAIIVGVLFVGTLADQQAPLTNTYSVSNQTVTFPANGATLELNGQALVGSLIATNATDGTVISSGNYTLTDLVYGTSGYRLLLTVDSAEYASTSVNLSYGYEPVGYNQSGSSRTVLGLVLIFFAIAVFALAIPDSREWLFNLGK